MSDAVSTLTLPFHTRGCDGQLLISMHPNDDPYATGHDQVAMNFDAEAFKGFPVVQLIRHLRRGQVIDEEIDTNPLLAGTPLYVVGYRPTFADAPANPDHRDLDWRADAFLVDIGPQHLSPITGFSWGYRRFLNDRTELIDPEPADDHAWRRIKMHVDLEFTSWTAAASN